MRSSLSSKPRWLIISQVFNCDGRAASQTITDKISYLEAAGIDLTVVSSVTGERDVHIPHYQVWPIGPAGIRFEYRHIAAKRHGRGKRYRLQTVALSILLSPLILLERILTGLSTVWSWPPVAAVRAWKLNRQIPFDLIYSTGGPVSAHLAGWLAHRFTGLPWIAEVHDPIVTSNHVTECIPAKRLSREHRLERWLERCIANDATAAWWFTSAALVSARMRNPQLGKKGFYILPGSLAPDVQSKHQYESFLRIAHFGSLSSSRSMLGFLQALSIWMQENPTAHSLLRVHIYGSALDNNARQFAQKNSLLDMLVCHNRLERNPITGESGRTQVTRAMQECDALLLLHGRTPLCSEYIPSKLYEYLWARRPILALTHENPQLDSIVTQHGGIVAHEINQNSIIQAINIIWNRWNTRSLHTISSEPIGVEQAVQTILQHIQMLNEDKPKK